VTVAVGSDFAALDRITAGRHSCRAFTSDEVPRDVIATVLETAQRTPSWCNTQPWAVTVLSGAATVALSERLYASAVSGAAATYDLDTPTYEGESLERRRAAGWALYEAVGCERGDRAATQNQALENFRFFGAPHVAVITSERRLGSYGVLDCGGYVNSFLTVATSLGLGAIAQAAVVSHGEVIRDHLNIGSDRVLVCGIAFGYEDVGHAANGFRTERADWRASTTFLDGAIR